MNEPFRTCKVAKLHMFILYLNDFLIEALAIFSRACILCKRYTTLAVHHEQTFF